MIKQWYEQLRNQCSKCHKYLAMEIVKETYKYFHWKCKFCGFKRRQLIHFADYIHKDGKTYLKRNGWKDYREVYLHQGKKSWRIKEVKQLNLLN